MIIERNKLILIKEQEIEYKNKICSPDELFNFAQSIIKINEEPDEVLYLVNFSSDNVVQSFMEVARGSSNCCCVNMADILKRVIISNCKKFIIIHNHPSGNAKPSAVDKLFTEDLIKSSELLDLKLLDHLIIGDNRYNSLLKW